jgi:tRNA threonylcarbamoyl adenosine modification protein YeaZ
MLPVQKSRYIAWDTSSTTGALVAIEIVSGSNPVLVAEWSLSIDSGRHSERLLWAIDQTLKSSDWELSSLSAIGIGVGPGSFTGLRLGISTARMFAEQLSIPLIPISSLEVLARRAAKRIPQNEREATWVLAATDAAKGEWFVLSGLASEVLEKKRVPSVMQPEAAIQICQNYLDQNVNSRWTVIGQAMDRYPQMLSSLPMNKKVVLDEDFISIPSPRLLAEIMIENINLKQLHSFADVHPLYLRASDAQVKLEMGLLKPSPRS